MAQSIVGTNLAVTAETKGARPCLKVEVAWGKKWSDTIAGGDWIDETQYVLPPVSVDRALADPASGFTMVGQTITASATVQVDNAKANFRFSPFNSSSAIYSSIRDGQIRNTPIRISMGFHDDTELIVNGGMELDDDWVNFFSPTTNERSSTQVRFGTYSRHVVTDSHNDGIRSENTHTTVTGTKYWVEAWVYITSLTATNVILSFRSGDGVTYTTIGSATAIGSWVKISGTMTESNGGSSSAVIIPQAGAGTAEYYVDGVSVTAVENPELLRQFTGLISSQPSSSTKQAMVTWSCMGRSEAVKDIQGRTTITSDITLTDWIEALLGETDIASADWNLDIDDSELQYMWLDDEYIWMKLQEAAEAAGGMIYFDHSGVLRFEGMQHWVDGSDHTSSQYTYTTGKLVDLNPEYRYNDGYSSVRVEYIRRSQGYTETVWSDQEPELIGPGESIKRIARLEWPCTEITTPEADVDYTCITAAGSNKNDDATVAITTYAAQVEIEITNSNATYAIIAQDLQLRGRPLIGGPNAEVKKITAAGYISDTKEFPITENQCIQSFAQAEKLATFYRDRLERVPCIFTIPPSPAKPWLELGDRATIVVSDEGINLDVYIVGETHDYGDMYLMGYRCLEAKYLYPVSTYFNWGDNLENLTVYSTTDNNDQALGHAARIKIAASITAPSTFVCRAAALYLLRVGTPGGKVRVVIYSDSGGLPDAAIAGGESRWTDAGDIDVGSTAHPAQWYPFPLPEEPTLTNGVVYHIVLESDSDYTFDDGVDEIVWRSDNVGSGGNGELYNGAAWLNNPSQEMPSMEYALPLFY